MSGIAKVKAASATANHGPIPSRPLAEAHALASDVEERIRRAHPKIADVVVHTEP